MEHGTTKVDVRDYIHNRTWTMFNSSLERTMKHDDWNTEPSLSMDVRDYNHRIKCHNINLCGINI